MTPFFKMLSLTTVTWFAACVPNSEPSLARVELVRRDVLAARMSFEEIAASLVAGSITWANRDSVRYKIGDEYKTENWGAASVPLMIKNDFIKFITLHNVEAVFVHDTRVNFVIHSAGIGPSGETIGVLIAPEDRHGCSEINTPVKLNARGMQCEKSSESAYVYIDR